MNPFPFTSKEWRKVRTAGHALMNATLAYRDKARMRHLLRLEVVIAELREKYGDHPVLTETLADFVDSPKERVSLYRCALAAAFEHCLPTYTIRISLARVLIEEFNQMTEAGAELALCRGEVMEQTDEAVTREWKELVRQCAG